MKIRLLYTGKPGKETFSAGINEYENRIKRYFPFEVIRVLPVKYSSKSGPAEKKILESAKLSQQITETDVVILLDEKGKEMTSSDFSGFLGKHLASSGKRLVFIIGGPFGFDEKLHSRANGMISLSKMTFPHQMVRLFFLEQVYRALTILHNEPYHHE